ncbi:unnamed protein product [Pylaiella littoralis]
MVVSPVPMTKQARRDCAIAELLNSEADYVSDLKLLVDVFLLPLERWAKDLEAERELVYDYSRMSDSGSPEQWAPDFTQADCDKIFANTLQLTRFHRQFLLDLSKAHGGSFVQDKVGFISPVSNGDDWRKVTTAGRDSLRVVDNDMDRDNVDPFVQSAQDSGLRQMLEVFLKSAPFLKMYTEYVNNFDAARERLATLERENLSFSAFLTACEKQKPCRGLRLRDFLVLPVQRIPRYRLLLEAILQHTAAESSVHSKAEESLSTMGGIASRIDADVSLQQQKNKVYRVQQEFGGASFVTASRLFIREGDLFKVARNGVEKLHFVLFNDLLVYGQAKRRRGLLGRGSAREQLYHHRRDINLSKCFVVDAPSYGNRCSSFLGETGMLVVSEEKSFMVMASTAIEKDGWLQAIRLCMRELSTKVEARERVYSSSNSKVLDEGAPSRQQQQQLLSNLTHGSSPSRWSLTSAHSVLAASAPRSAWVLGSTGSHKASSLRLVDFCLPSWAGVRTSCGCLSHTELIWGKGGLALAGDGADLDLESRPETSLATVSGGAGEAAGAASGVCGGRGSSPARIGHRNLNDDALYGQQQQHRLSEGALQASSETDSPRKVSLLIAMKPSEPMGLRLRDLHPECGGGVVVVGFQRSAAGKRSGVKQGDRITEVNGFSVYKTADIVWALQQQQQQQSPFDGGDSRTGGDSGTGRDVHLAVLRGFPKCDKPWMPRLMVEPSPTGTFLTPPSSAVESPGSVDDISLPSPQLSAPGEKTFSGISTSGISTLGFAGGGASGRRTAIAHRTGEHQPLSAATAGSTSTPGTTEGTDRVDYSKLLVVAPAPAPPSPETAMSTPARNLSTPGRKPFGGTGASDSSASDIGGEFCFTGADAQTPIAGPASLRKQMYRRSATAATVAIDSTDSRMSAAPPSPEEPKGDGKEDSGDSNGTGGDLTDSNGGGRALRGPAPTQANANAGGDPAIPFAVFRGGGRATPSRLGQRQQQQQQRGQGQSPLELELADALAAGWGGSGHGHGQASYEQEGNSRPAELDLDMAEDVDVEGTTIQKPSHVLLADISRGTSPSTVAGGSVCGDGSVYGIGGKHPDGDHDDEDDVFQDTLSVVSGSSARSSLYLTALSPSRIPPPLASVASTLPLPPVSMASSVMSGSFSNPWQSPTAESPEDSDSMPWLKPLPPPPPPPPPHQQQQQQKTAQPRVEDASNNAQDWGPFAASAASMSTVPPPTHRETELACPSGRWVQAPPKEGGLQQARAEPKS